MNAQSLQPPLQPLEPARLRRRCEPNQLAFTTTAEVPPIAGLIGQQRAVEAITFGLSVEGPDFNVYVAGPPGTGKSTAVTAFLERAARERPTPGGWWYVYNFPDPTPPTGLPLRPGRARRPPDAKRPLVRAARRARPRGFWRVGCSSRRETILSTLARRREEGMAQLSARAQAAGFLLQPTPVGIALIPVLGNRPVAEEEVATLPPEIRETILRRRAELENEVRQFLKAMRAAERETREQLEAQDRDVALHAVGGLIDDLIESYEEDTAVRAYLEEVREGILADIALFRSHPLPADGAMPEPTPGAAAEQDIHERAFRKYEVNVIVDNGGRVGAPVVTELNPTYPNLIGRIDREALFGALVTDFTLIVPGALHRANGGYLVLRVEDVLRAPLAWDALKRALRARTVIIEEPAEVFGFTTTRGLRPDPIPLDLKVFLVGDMALYHLLYGLDPDFRELFKVRADFDVEMDRTPEHEAAYASFVATCSATNGRHMDRTGVARLIEESSRMVADQRKLSARFGEIADLIREASHWAQQDASPVITASHVRQAVEQRLYRTALVRERLNELIARGVLIVRPTGMAVGQVYGLAVVGVGEGAFGRPTRITATIGAGRDGVVDIERQAELGGRIHSKGVLILGGYLTDMYAQDKPLALTARLVFEQSYEEVEGDSASLAELLALLSRLADVPLKQGLAVTGSINQRGEVQAVGGVNEKVEGFYDACVAVGLTGEQGVVLPAANVENLMLRDDVLETVEKGQFHIYAVNTVDEALTVLTGLPAGPRGPDGTFPPDGIHARVDRRLRTLAEALREFAAPPEHAPAVAGGDGRSAPPETGER